MVAIRPNDKPFMNGNIRRLIRQRQKPHPKPKIINKPLKNKKLGYIRISKGKNRYFNEINGKINNVNTAGWNHWWKSVSTYIKNGDATSLAGSDGTVATSSENGLISTGFASQYRLQPRAGT